MIQSELGKILRFMQHVQTVAFTYKTHRLQTLWLDVMVLLFERGANDQHEDTCRALVLAVCRCSVLHTRAYRALQRLVSLILTLQVHSAVSGPLASTVRVPSPEPTIRLAARRYSSASGPVVSSTGPVIAVVPE